ncbi:hypothetical protein [Chondromyces crocatus]|uniref:Uncharacterized protein n=1 Tax=Chondromyces crocatus TaxID=52 RepID=A0A0K1EEN6_CHOCO|nr:hypothetical protein [Chondromyces crocatus]AKT39038.1 uncharacterized protein CMC5_031840 [Chondromyces crocatus]
MVIFLLGMVVILGTVGFLVVRFGMRPSAAEGPAAVLGPIGRRARATFARVDPPVILGRYGHGPSYNRVPVSLQLADANQVIETHLTCLSTHLHLLQPGAPCELLIDPADPTRLMVTGVQNAFGVVVPAEIGSSHFRW